MSAFPPDIPLPNGHLGSNSIFFALYPLDNNLLTHSNTTKFSLFLKLDVVPS